MDYDEDEIKNEDKDFIEIYRFNNRLISYFKSKGFNSISTGLDLDKIVK